MSHFETINKENIELLLNELAKEIRKEFGKNQIIELILVGGASVLLNYDFRLSTMDVDAIQSSYESLNSCIHKVADKYKLPNNWLNYDFKSTNSFSDKLRLKSQFYKTYGKQLKVYTIKDEYLICMKLVAFRDNDINDIKNIVLSGKANLSYEKIDSAMIELYGSWSNVSAEAKKFITILIPEKSIDSIDTVILKATEESGNVAEKRYKNNIDQFHER